MNELDKAKEELMKVIEKELQEYTDEIYRSGHEDGVKSVQLLGNRARDIGREEAWECVRKMWRMDFDDLELVFGTDDKDWILENFTASEAMQKIKDFEEGQVKKCGKCLISYNGAKCSSCEEKPEKEPRYESCKKCRRFIENGECNMQGCGGWYYFEEADEFYGDCNYCKYWSRTTDEYPCNECKHQYGSEWEKS